MDAMDTWLIQVDADTVNEHAQQLAYAEKPEPFWPPADRSGTDPQVGDRLVLWQMGTGEKAGAVALGTVAETDVRYHEQNYQLKAAESELRHSVRMNFTHWFSYDPVTRVELKKDPRFNDFVMFKQGGAQGKNPWILTDDQWCAIADHVPEWTALNYPKKPYSVRVECDFLRGEPNQLLGDFREVIMSGDYEWLGFSARTEQETVHEWDEYSVPYIPVPGVGAGEAQVVTWASTVSARSAEDAVWIGLYGLAVASDDLTIHEVEGDANRYEIRL